MDVFILEGLMILLAGILGYGLAEVKHDYDYMEGFKKGHHQGYMRALDDFDEDFNRGE